MRSEWLAALLLASFMYSSRVSAAPPPPAAPQPGVPSATPQDGDPKAAEETNEEKRPAYGYWSEEKARWFVGLRPEIGAPFLKPVALVGYGVPHWIYGSVDATALLTTEMFQVLGTIRFALPILDISLLLRDTWSLDKPFLAPKDSFQRSDVSNAPGPNARYTALEGEIDAIAPLPHAALVFAYIFVNVLDKPGGRYLYEENYRVVIKDSFFHFLRFAAVARFLGEDSLKIGILSEFGFGTGRGDQVFRAGPIISVQLTDHVSASAGATVMLHSPDHLGLTMGAYGVAGFQFKYATGERRARWPWNEKFIPF